MDAFSSSEYMASNRRISNGQLIRKYLKGIGRGLISGSPGIWLGGTGEKNLGIIGFQVEIWIRDF
jgi:hypothetical protein